MRPRCSLAATLAILAILVTSPLRADDLYETFSPGVTPPAGLPPLVESSNRSETFVAASQSEDLSSGVAAPIYSLADPNCCNQPCGMGCSTCDPCGGCGTGFRTRFVPYGWLFAVHGDATVRGLTTPVDISMRNTLHLLEHNMHFIFSGKLEVENDEVGLIVNGFYVNAGFSNSLRRLNFDSTFKMAIVDVAATYNLIPDPECSPIPYVSRFDVLAGIRYWQLDGSIAVTGPLGNTRGRSGEREWVDPIVGARVIVPLTAGVDAQLRGDIGGFDWGTASEFTWNLEALVAMRWNECLSLRGGYRVLDVDNSQDSGNNRFGFDVQFRGPVVEVALEF